MRDVVAATFANPPAPQFCQYKNASLYVRRSITATLSALPGEDVSIGSAGSLAARHAYQPAEWASTQSGSSTITSDEEGEGDESGYASLERFLTAWGLSQYVQKFKDEQIDLDALMLLTESDLKSLGLPLGPYRKLVTAVQERKQALSHPGPMIDTAI
ncbi:Usher syndrome type-1G protein-like [Zerene cesonia]|uniref:Usher syndrome type-1G protein-like n=1 Tax=Zerene cesonia TaxID=33412 RepID=UPI0018E4DE02|nr:Usher syndrome type-1G protein-like [Zerene cesonia]